MKNNKGFVLLSLLTMWPLILSILVVVSSSSFYLKKRVETLHFCRTVLLEIQRNMSRSLYSLLSLNPQAQHLRKQEASTRKKIQIASATAPELLPLLEARLATIHLKQIKLRAKQNLIIKKSEMSGTEKINHLRNKISRAQTNKPRLAVIASPTTSLSPDYKIAPDFTNIQKIYATWSATAESFMYPWLLQFLTDLPNLELGCAASIKEVDNKWKEKLVSLKEDKYY